MNKKIDTKEYETMTQHDLIEILNHWEQLAFQKTNEVKRAHSEIEHLNKMFCVGCGACGTETEYAECTCTEEQRAESR